MSNPEIHSGSEANSGLDAASGLPGGTFHLERDPFKQPFGKTPTALGNYDHRPIGSEDLGNGSADPMDPLTGWNTKGSMVGHGYEFESGIAPIDHTVHLAGKALDAVDQVIETSTPAVKQVIHQAVNQISETVQDSIEMAQKNWNAPENQIRNRLSHRMGQAMGFFEQKLMELSTNSEVKTALDTTQHFGRNIVEKTQEVIRTAQTATEAWIDQAFDSSYVDRSLSCKQDNQHHSDLPFVGVIDTNFGAKGHGSHVVDTVRQAGQRPPDWLGDGVGTGQWAESLVQFVDAAKASGRTQAVVNLSFDLTQINPDGSVTTRHQLTREEYAALSYAQESGVLLVVSTGNQGNEMSALGQASQAFDNIIAVGAVENGQRADYSSYGSGVDIVASGKGKGDIQGTSFSTARVTGAIVQIWEANSHLSYRQVVEALAAGAKDLQAPGYDPYTGYGKLNTDLSVEIAETKGDRLNNLGKLSPSIDHEVSANQLFTVRGDDLAIAGARPAFLEGLQEQFQEHVVEPLQEHIVEPIVERIPEPIKSAASTVKETVTSFIENPTNLPGDLREAVGDLTTAAQGLDYPGYVFNYEPRTTPSYDPKVEQWQERMREREWKIEVDGYYGAHSAEVARRFQEEKGLVADGIVGAETWAATFSTRNETGPSSQAPSGALPDGVSGTGGSSSQVFRYDPGQSLTYNADVERWQQRMSDRGWEIEVDGYYGSHSAEIARRFQAEKGLVADGIVGERTWEATFDTSNVTAGSSGAALTPDLPSNLPELSNNNATQALLAAAGSYVGVREQGENRGSEVERFQSLLNGAQGEAWCMSFVQYCINAAEGATQSNSSVAQSEGCVDVWNRSPDSLKHSRPEVGSLVIWQDRGKTTGHVGIVESVNADGSFTTIEGNTTDDSGTGVEGVHRRQRTMADMGNRFVLGFLKVFPGDTSSIVPTSMPREMLRYEAGQPLMQGEPVREWQEFLNEQGHDIMVDGVYGEESAAATRKFQWLQGIADDGIVGEETIAAAENVGFGITSHIETIGDPNLQDSSQEEFTAYNNIDNNRGIALSNNNPFGTEIEPVPSRTEIGSPPSGTIFGFIKDRDGSSEPVYLQRYGSEGPVEQEIEPNKETVVVIHGWNPDKKEYLDIAGETVRPSLEALAKQVASSNPNLQVLFLDWSSLSNTGFAPRALSNAAEHIAPVARWAQDRLVELGVQPDQLTLLGHSFGSYVSAEIGRTFDAEKQGKVKNLVALDPASGSFLGGWTTIDHESIQNRLPADFNQVASNSLSFVASDAGGTTGTIATTAILSQALTAAALGSGMIGSGIAGDNGKAATAHNSFVVNYNSRPNLFVAHNEVVDVFTNALAQEHLTLPNLTLPAHSNNWYNHDGTKAGEYSTTREDVSEESGLHEGRIEVESTGQDWNKGNNPRRIREVVVADSTGFERTDWG